MPSRIVDQYSSFFFQNKVNWREVYRKNSKLLFSGRSLIGRRGPKSATSDINCH